MKTSRLALIFTSGVLMLASLLPSQPANAVSASDWNAGNIVDDGIFTNPDSMSVNDIQVWLNNRIPNCDTNGVQMSELGGGTRAQYGAAHGNPIPFTCLNNYYEVPKTQPGPGVPANNYGGKAIPPGAKSAAQIISDAAHTYNISPRVILVKLGTESVGPLTSDTWPLLKQYNYAMGSHCPDSGPGGTANCDTNYAGFSLQVYSGTELLRYYLDNMNQPWWSYKKPFQVNSILWNVVQKGCGAGDVYIQSKSTAALYTYTPYQPNAAALANMYGTGDGCSAYGNRNFWRVFNDWFGATTGTPFFSNNGRVYITGDNNTYYYVPSQALLSAYGFGSRFSSITPVSNAYLSDRTFKGNLNWIARFGNTSLPIYVVSGNQLHQFTSPDAFTNYGYSYGQESVLPASLANSYNQSMPMSEILKQSDRPEVYLVTNGKKQHISNETAYTTLGSPVYSSRVSVTTTSSYTTTLPDSTPIIANNTIVKATDTGKLWIYAEGKLYPASSTSINAWTVSLPTYETTSSKLASLPQNPSAIQSFVVDQTSGMYYVLDGGRKLSISVAQMTQDGLTLSQFIPVPSSFLTRFTNANFSQLLQPKGSLAVYTPVGGKYYHIYSEQDLTGLGFSWSQLQNISTTTFSRLPVTSTSLFAKGRLLRVDGQLAVYMVGDNFTLRHIPSENLLYSYGFSYSKVSVLPPSENITSYVKVNPLSRYVRDSSGSVWLIDSNKRWLVDSGIQSALSLTPEAIDSGIDNSIINNIPTSPKPLNNLVRASDQLKVYVIENGKKRWITSEQKLSQLGYTQAMVSVISSDFLQSVVTGADY